MRTSGKSASTRLKTPWPPWRPKREQQGLLVRPSTSIRTICELSGNAALLDGVHGRCRYPSKTPRGRHIGSSERTQTTPVCSSRESIGANPFTGTSDPRLPRARCGRRRRSHLVLDRKPCRLRPAAQRALTAALTAIAEWTAGGGMTSNELSRAARTGDPVRRRSATCT